MNLEHTTFNFAKKDAGNGVFLFVLTSLKNTVYQRIKVSQTKSLLICLHRFNTRQQPDYDLENMKRKLSLNKVKVSRQTEIAPGVFVLSFPRPWDFVAGQVLGIGAHETDEARLYSIASGELDDEVDILYNINPDGKLTPWLAKVNTGDNIWVSEPFGSFTGTGEPGWWIASGTGIAPFSAMFRTGLTAGKKLLHGGRDLHSFYFHEKFKSTFGDNYVRCCSREEGPEIYPGRLTKYLSEQEQLPANEKYYLCGSAEMVVEVRDLLISKGIPFNNIISEIYF